MRFAHESAIRHKVDELCDRMIAEPVALYGIEVHEDNYKSLRVKRYDHPYTDSLIYIPILAVNSAAYPDAQDLNESIRENLFWSALTAYNHYFVLGDTSQLSWNERLERAKEGNIFSTNDTHHLGWELSPVGEKYFQENPSKSGKDSYYVSDHISREAVSLGLRFQRAALENHVAEAKRIYDKIQEVRVTK